jgi:hypothetical protein
MCCLAALVATSHEELENPLLASHPWLARAIIEPGALLRQTVLHKFYL